MQDLWRLSAAEMASLIGSKKVSAKEAATAALARLDAVNPKINAVVDHRPEDVLAQAAAIDAAIGRGEDPGPLGGVPVTVKVNIDQEGFATTNGLKLQRDAIAKSNNPVIDNLRKSGAVILGRTNCPAFSYRWFTSNLIHGDTKNPRDPGITPGGSSGGAGAAVAAGIGHIAHGTDIAGSIRYPAYACGVHGLRPTMGRIAAFNAALPERPIGPQISAVSGPLARTIGDIRIALAAMSARDYRDPWWVPAPLEGPAMPKRVAMCLNPDGLDPVPEVKAAVADAGKRLARAGWIAPDVLCRQQAQHPLIDVRLNCAVKNLERADTDWLLRTEQGDLRAGIVVIANAVAAYGGPISLTADGSHWVETGANTFSPAGTPLATDLMTSLFTAHEQTALSDTTVGVFADLGYTVQDPSPGASYLLLDSLLA